MSRDLAPPKGTPPQALRQHGVFTRQQALVAGWTRNQVAYRVRTGEWVIVAGHGLCAETQSIEFIQRAWAGQLTWPDACLWGPSAMAAWRELDPREPPVAHTGEVHLAVPWHRRPQPGLRAHQVDVPEWDIMWMRGLRTQAPGSAQIDSLATMPLPHSRSLAAFLVTREQMPLDAFDQALQEYRLRPGAKQLRRLRPLFAGRAASEAELAFHELLRQAGITGWKPNERVVLNDRRWVCVDILFPDLKLVIEIDGPTHYSDVEARDRDNARDADLFAAGYHVLRLSTTAIQRDPAETVERIRAAVARLAVPASAKRSVR